MARFPITETQIEALARRMIAGFIEHTDVFPSPWVHPEKLEATLREFTAASERAVETRAAAKLASKKKKEGVGTGFGGVKYYNVERKRTDEDDWELIRSAARTGK